MIDLVNIATFVWLALWALLAIRMLSLRVHYSISFAMVFLFILGGIPLLLDVMFGKPIYLNHPGFQIASRDDTTNLLFCFYVSICPVLWWFTGRPKKHLVTTKREIDISAEDIAFTNRLRPIFYLCLLSPIIVLLFAPTPEAYLNYAAVTKRLLSPEARDYHSIIALSCKLGIFSAAGLMLASRFQSRIWTFLCLLPWMTIAIWLEGKRLIVVTAIGLILFSLWYRRLIKITWLFALIIFALFLFALFSYSYQSGIRPFSLGEGDIDLLYRNLREELGRDDVIKMVIFSELYPERLKIFPARGESLRFYATMYVPRKFWPNKPWPYSVHITSAALGIPLKYVGWGLTTSWLDEAVANFSWLGFLIGPLLISIVCRLGDSCNKAYIQLLTIMTVFYLIGAPLTANVAIIMFWAGAVIMVHWPRMKQALALN